MIAGRRRCQEGQARIDVTGSPVRAGRSGAAHHKWTGRLVSATLLACAALTGAGAAADAKDGDSPAIWSVMPSGPTGPDGRHWFELELDPGQQVTDYLAVKNLADHSITFSLSAADGYFTPTGRFNMLTVPTESVDAGRWIGVAQTVTVEPEETAIVPFLVSVPANAEPGDHAAGIAAAVMSSASDQGGASLGVVSRFGVRVMTRVTGRLEPSLEIDGVAVDYDMSWNPSKAGRLRAGFDLVNTGNARLTVDGLVSAGGGGASFPTDGAPTIELLPGDRQHVDITLERIWPLFKVRAEIEAQMHVVALSQDAGAPALEPVTRAASAWAVPWPHLAILSGLALVLAAFIGGRRRNRRRVDELVAQARAEGRAETWAARSGFRPIRVADDDERAEGTE